MPRPKWAVILLLTLTAIGSAPVAAQNVGAPAASDLRVDWSVKTLTPAVVEGYVVNTADWWARRVVLAVETLDASGRVLGRTPVALAGDIPPGGRLYFSEKLRAPGSTYRVSVQSFERFDTSQI